MKKFRAITFGYNCIIVGVCMHSTESVIYTIHVFVVLGWVNKKANVGLSWVSVEKSDPWQTGKLWEVRLL